MLSQAWHTATGPQQHSLNIYCSAQARNWRGNFSLKERGAGRGVSNLRIINHTLKLSPLQISSLSQNEGMGKQIHPGWQGRREGGSSVCEGRRCVAEKLEKGPQDVLVYGCGALLVAPEIPREWQRQPWLGDSVGVSSSRLECHHPVHQRLWLDPQSGHTPRLWVQSLVGACAVGN